MKRTDMVMRIAEWMEQNNDDPLLTPLCAAEAFLDLVEDIGMKPPYRPSDEKVIRCQVSEWEPE